MLDQEVYFWSAAAALIIAILALVRWVAKKVYWLIQPRLAAAVRATLAASLKDLTHEMGAQSRSLASLQTRFNSLLTQLSKSDDQYAMVAIALTAHPAMVVDGERGVILRVNRHLERILGWGPGRLDQQTVDLVIPPRFRAKHHDYRANYMHEPVPRDMATGRDLRVLTASGAELPCVIGLIPLGAERVLAYIAITADGETQNYAYEPNSGDQEGEK